MEHVVTASSSNYDKCIAALTSVKAKYPAIVDEFIAWYEDGQWEDDGLEDDFGEDAEESSFVDWINEEEVISTDEEGLRIWTLCHNAIRNIKPKAILSDEPRRSARGASVIVELLSVDIEPKEKKKNIESSKSPIKQRISVQSPSSLPQFGKKKKNDAQDILTVEFLGYKNHNYPLLLHFVDAYVRCQLNEWIINGKKHQSKFSPTEFFEKHCPNPMFQQYLKQNKALKTVDFVRTSIQSYQKRVVPTFQLKEPTYKINGNILDCAQYLFEIARIAKNIATQPIHNLTTIIPVQLDFLLLNGQCIEARPQAMECKGVSALFDEEDYDDFDEDKNEEDEEDAIAKNIDKLLKSKNIKYYAYDRPLRDMLRCTEDIKRAMDNKRSQRAIFVLDRRNNKKKDVRKPGTDGDKLYMFKPKKYNQFEGNDQELIHTALHHNSVSSMLPRIKGKDKKGDFSVREGLKGQMFVLSFHILSNEEIRCYLFYQGQCFRFYGEDLFNVLPMFYLDTKGSHDILLQMYKEQKWRKSFHEFCDSFVDKKFDRFYFGLTNKGPRIKVVH